MKAIEPACGHGSFLVPMVERLAESCELHGRDLRALDGAIEAYDLQPTNVAESRTLVAASLNTHGLMSDASEQLASVWVQHSDFLLAAHRYSHTDFVIGNPPYVRLEAVSEERSAAYRRVCSTMGGRSDIYVGFFEVGLKSLKAEGTLGFICADRWMRNQYGQRLRAWVAENFSVEATIEMHDVDAFDREVSAYPSVVVVRHRQQRPALVANTSSKFDRSAARRLVAWSSSPVGAQLQNEAFEAAELESWFNGNSPWPSGSPGRIAALKEIEGRLPTLESSETGTRVGIGVATGADRVFIAQHPPDVEADRLLPLAMAGDTHSGQLEWSGHYLVNPWSNGNGGLVRLENYPKLRAYMNDHSDVLRSRNVAGRRPAQWFRTIDRVDGDLTGRPKLFIPDIKAELHPVIDHGEYYPHHNLYFVDSECWDLRALGGLLLSDVAQMFIEAYAVRMRGGYLRFQAQYLRRIRIPVLDSIRPSDIASLIEAFESRDRECATSVALKLYGLDRVPT